MIVEPDARIVKEYPFHWREIRYIVGHRCPQHLGEMLLPEVGSPAALGIERTVQLVLGPLRVECGLPIFIVGGGGYDPLRHPETGIYVSHRGNTEKPSTTQHRFGALDLRVGHSRRGPSFPAPWTYGRVGAWLRRQLSDLEIEGGLGRYTVDCFWHIDLRARGARWGK